MTIDEALNVLSKPLISLNDVADRAEAAVELAKEVVRLREVVRGCRRDDWTMSIIRENIECSQAGVIYDREERAERQKQYDAETERLVNGDAGTPGGEPRKESE